MPANRLGLLALATGLLAAAAGADEVTTVAGKKITGTLVKLDPEAVTFQGAAEFRLAVKELLAVDLGNKVVAPRQGARFHDVELTDGSTLRCDKFAVKGKKAVLDLLAGPDGVPAPVFDLPLANVFYLLRGADDAKNREEWRRMLLTRGKRDLYVIRQTDGLNILQGTVLDGSPDGALVGFEREDGTRENLRLSRATGGLVLTAPPGGQVPPTACKVHDVFGNVLVARAAELTDAGLRVTTVAGVVVTYPSLAGVAKLDFSQGNLAYLSDLRPQVDVPELPPNEAAMTLGVKAPYLSDKAPANKPLSLGGTSYPKGLWVQAGTALTYDIGGDFREFKAVIGVHHDQTGDSGVALKVTISADERVLFAETVRKDNPKPVTLDIKSVKSLRIVVDSDAAAITGREAVIGIAQIQK